MWADTASPNFSAAVADTCQLAQALESSTWWTIKTCLMAWICTNWGPLGPSYRGWGFTTSSHTSAWLRWPSGQRSGGCSRPMACCHCKHLRFQDIQPLADRSSSWAGHNFRLIWSACGASVSLFWAAMLCKREVDEYCITLLSCPFIKHLIPQVGHLKNVVNTGVSVRS